MHCTLFHDNVGPVTRPGGKLDTNIYRNWANGRLLDIRRELIRRRIPIFLAPTVIIEAIEDYWFNSDHVMPRRALKYILRNGAHRILQPEHAFLASTFGLPPQPYGMNMRPGQLRKWLWFAIGLHPSRRKKGTDGKFAFDRNSFKNQVDAYRDGYSGMLKEMRAAVLAAAGLPATAIHLNGPDAANVRQYLKTQDWRQMYFRRIADKFWPGGDGSAAAVRLHKAMNAAFEFDTAIAVLTMTTEYKPEKHRGNPFDHALLTYLADPGLVFITADGNMVGKVANSQQTKRIRLVGEGRVSTSGSHWVVLR